MKTSKKNLHPCRDLSSSSSSSVLRLDDDETRQEKDPQVVVVNHIHNDDDNNDDKRPSNKPRMRCTKVVVESPSSSLAFSTYASPPKTRGSGGMGKGDKENYYNDDEDDDVEVVRVGKEQIQLPQGGGQERRRQKKKVGRVLCVAALSLFLSCVSDSSSSSSSSFVVSTTAAAATRSVELGCFLWLVSSSSSYSVQAAATTTTTQEELRDDETMALQQPPQEMKQRRVQFFPAAMAAPAVSSSSSSSPETSKASSSSSAAAAALSTSTSTEQARREAPPASSPSQETMTLSQILTRAGKRGLGGGIPGAIAGVVQVLSMMWLRTICNHQYRYGTTFAQASRILWNEGGLRRFYRGLAFALVQAPLVRFVSTAANDGVETLLQGLSATKSWGPGRTTLVASVVVGLWRMLLLPIDTCKTVLQVDSAEGFKNLRRKVQAGKIGVLYEGALANALSAVLAHYPWFFTFNALSHNAWMQRWLSSRLLRNGVNGFISSLVSDSVTNCVRVVKTTKQALASKHSISYWQAIQMILAADGWKGLFGRGLQTRILTNALQSVLFTIIWRGLAERWKSPEPSSAKTPSPSPKDKKKKKKKTSSIGDNTIGEETTNHKMPTSSTTTNKES